MLHAEFQQIGYLIKSVQVCFAAFWFVKCLLILRARYRYIKGYVSLQGQLCNLEGIMQHHHGKGTPSARHLNHVATRWLTSETC